MTDAAPVRLLTGEEASAQRLAIVGTGVDAGHPSLAAILRMLERPPANATQPAHEVHVVGLRNADGLLMVNPHFGADATELARLAAMVTNARLRGKPVAIVGATAEHFSSAVQRHLIRTIFKASDLSVFLDEASADAVASAGIEPPFRMGADPAWLELSELMAAPAPDDARVVIAVGNDARMPHRDVVALGATIDRLTAEGLQVRIHARPAGVPTARRLAAASVAQVHIDSADGGLRHLREHFAGARLVLANEAHALMAAMAAGRAAAAFGSDARVHRLADEMRLHGVTDASDSAASVAELLRRSVGDPDDRQRRIRAYVGRARSVLDLVSLVFDDRTATTDLLSEPLPLYPKPWRS